MKIDRRKMPPKMRRGEAMEAFLKREKPPWVVDGD